MGTKDEGGRTRDEDEGRTRDEREDFSERFGLGSAGKAKGNQPKRKKWIARDSARIKSILPSAPSDDGNDNNNDNDIEDEYPRSKFDKYYDEKEELKRIKSRREEELARRQNEVLPRE